MRVKKIAAILTLTATLALAGCTASDLTDRADQLDTGAAKVRQVVADIEQGRADHADLIAVLDQYVPEQLRPGFRRALDIADDVPDTGRQIAVTLDGLARDFRAQAAEDRSRSENAVFGIISITDALIGTNGLLAGLAALSWKRRRDSDRITEDIVTSIESSKPVMDAIDNHGGDDDLRKSMAGPTQKRVAEIKKAIAS